MQGYKTDIEKKTMENKAYRRVLNTTKESQLVVMSIPPGDDINRETHSNTTQFIRVEDGTGFGYIGTKRYNLRPGSVLMIPSGLEHYVKNSGDVPLKLYTIYSPPEHRPGLVQYRHP